MKAAEWKRIVRPALPADCEWEIRGSLYYIPGHRILRGVMSDGSGFDQGVYAWHVSMPLFVPSDVVDLSWSERIGGKSRKFYAYDEESLQTAVAVTLRGQEDEEAALRRMASREIQTSKNRRIHEVVGYASLILGDFGQARDALGMAGRGSPKAPWEQQIVERSELICRLLDEAGSGPATEKLDEWCDRTAAALSLRRSGVVVNTEAEA